jgi:hypothetical protein
MLPNPTPYHWDKNSFNLRRLVREYQKRINDLDLVPLVPQLVDDTDILVQALNQDKKSWTPGYSIPLLNTLHDTLDRCDDFIRESDRELVRIVIREHFQEVLKLINAEGESTNNDNGSVGIWDQRMDFGVVTAASPEARQDVFMDLYFYTVLGQVTGRAVLQYRRQRVAQHAPGLDDPDTPKPSLELQASAIWCTLVLRMMCWLLLHDFHENDVQVPKSGLLGSRLPVYIL